MKQLKLFTIAGIIFVLAAGTFAHFLYGWTNNNLIVGLFTPVNESIWEHIKLLFFPTLLYALFTIPKLKTNYPCIGVSLCFGILLGSIAVPLLFYGYTSVLKQDIFFLDIGIFILSTILTFAIACRFTVSCRLKSYEPLLYGLIVILFFCFLIFTYYPPRLELFNGFPDTDGPR